MGVMSWTIFVVVLAIFMWVVYSNEISILW
jgi:hypothetical protein